MDLVKFNNLLRVVLPLTEAQRFRGKINIQRPRSPHFLRKLEIEFTKYIIPRKEIDPIERCIKERTKTRKVDIENPYQKIIANDCRNWFDHSKMVAIFHCNSLNSADMFKLQVPLQTSNMYVKKYGSEIMKTAFENTKYTTLLPLFETHNLIVFSAEPQVAKLLKIVKKTPQLILLAGIIEGKLLHKDEFTNYSKLPDLQTARASLAQLLLSAGSQLTSQLNQHQNSLIQHLENRRKQLEGSK